MNAAGRLKAAIAAKQPHFYTVKVSWRDIESLLAAATSAEKALNEAGFYIASLGHSHAALTNRRVKDALAALHAAGVGGGDNG